VSWPLEIAADSPAVWWKCDEAQDSEIYCSGAEALTGRFNNNIEAGVAGAGGVAGHAYKFLSAAGVFVTLDSPGFGADSGLRVGITNDCLEYLFYPNSETAYPGFELFAWAEGTLLTLRHIEHPSDATKLKTRIVVPYSTADLVVDIEDLADALPLDAWHHIVINFDTD